MSRAYIGIDNGTTGTMGVVGLEGGASHFLKVPIKKEQSYTIKKQNITRIDFHALYDFLKPFSVGNCFALLERPLINPRMFATSMSAIRTLEAEILILEALHIPFQYCDSKHWQNLLLPKGIKGSAELKSASRDIGGRLFPLHKELINKHKDADGLLIAEFARRSNF